MEKARVNADRDKVAFAKTLIDLITPEEGKVFLTMMDAAFNMFKAL